MRSHLYRVWSEEDQKFFSSAAENVFLGPDGLLYEFEMDFGWAPLVPSTVTNAWLARYRKLGRKHATAREKAGGRGELTPQEQEQQTQEFARLATDQEAEVQALQGTWYTVEFATGYLDTADAMIYDGDIVVLIAGEDDGERFQVAWGHFSDCCVEGEAWILVPEQWQPALGHWCDNEDQEGRRLTVVDNIHQTPHLLLGASGAMGEGDAHA